ncbi:hypothetical protein ACFLRP_00210 [Bacteroidota bacterium]
MRKSIFILISLIIVALLSFGCSQQGNQENYAQGFQDGYAKGYLDGIKAGTGEAAIPPSLKPSTPQSTPKQIPTPSGSISWSEAKAHIGERATVCGPVAGAFYSSGSKGTPTFLNIGKDHPSSERFTVVIWGSKRGNFPSPPDSYYRGKNICVTGLITEYQGIAQIEAKDPSQIQVQ